MFDKVVAFDSILYRLSDVHKSSDFVDGREALRCARFNIKEERVALAVCVIDSSGSKHFIYVFFSVNFRLPGIVIIMPDPDGETTKQCVSLVDFYDPAFWRFNGHIVKWTRRTTCVSSSVYHDICLCFLNCDNPYAARYRIAWFCRDCCVTQNLCTCKCFL